MDFSSVGQLVYLPHQLVWRVGKICSIQDHTISVEYISSTETSSASTQSLESLCDDIDRTDVVNNTGAGAVQSFPKEMFGKNILFVVSCCGDLHVIYHMCISHLSSTSLSSYLLIE
jgi:hypothetical protein